MGTDHCIGHCRLHRVQLYIHTGRIPRVGRGSHRVFQGILQVPLPDSLPFGGCGHTFLHPQFSRILTISGHETELPYKISWNLTEQGCPTGRLFLFSALCGTGNKNDRNKRKRDENTNLAYRKLPGKVGKCLCSDGKVKPCGFGKNHPHCVAVFFPKTLPYRRHLPSGPCSSRAAKARIFTIKKLKSHEPSICHKRTAGSHEDAHAGSEKKKTGGTRTLRQVPATGDDRTGTHLHPVEPDSGNMPPSRQEQAVGQTVQ